MLTNGHVMQKTKSIDLNGIRTYILNKLEQDLSPLLTYHSLRHTLDVEQSALLLAKEENLSEHETLLVQTAALFHDSGFLDVYSNNESYGAKQFENVALDYGYNTKEVEIIKEMILSTHHTVSPKNLMEKILCDADHDYLGRHDYYEIAENLHKELAVFFKEFEENRWVEIQYDYLKNRHKYNTITAINKRLKLKKQRITELKSQLIDYKK
jgi:HD superfamily phosphodiesterase